jgi:radical SAM protein (TIGR01212 family)
MQRYRTYSRFLKEKFGCRVRKVSVDAGFTCPNRDGRLGMGGCIYCNNNSFRPETASRRKSVREQVEEGIEYLKTRYCARKFIVYFQPFTNTYAPLQDLIPLYESAIDHPDVVGLSIGTRPDCVDEGKIAWFERLARTHFVTLEYGLESVDDASLERIHRGHNFQCWLDAMKLTRNRGIFLCAHIILGFPWEARGQVIRSAEVLSSQSLDFLKIHHLHVVRGTLMADQFREKPFPLLSVEEYADLVIDFLERLSPDIWLERLVGSAPENQLVGPIWGKSKAEIQRVIDKRFEERNTWQGRLANLRLTIDD